MAECTVEKWTLKELSDALSSGKKDKIRIVVPMFQRGKRWDNNADKELKFIDSLQKNYPVGTLLFYKTEEDGQKIYTLIDGLQRSTTINKFLNKPTKYFEIKSISTEVLNELFVELKANKGDEKLITDILINYIRELNSFEAFDMIQLVHRFGEKFPIDINSFSNINKILNNSIKELKDDFDKLCKIEIPALIYTGPEETLAEIFDRVNSQGVPLSDYEIFVASWPKDKFIVNNEAIIEKNIEKYDYLSSDVYELKDYDRDSFRKEKKLNAFEYVFGLSKYLCEKYDCLKFNMNIGSDIANPVGFELLNAIYYTSHKKLKDVYQIPLKFSDQIENLEHSLEDSVEFVSSCISPITRFKSNTHGESGKVFHSQLQILSMISFVFRKKYDIETLKEKKSWFDDCKILKENLIKYYVLDIITKYWHEGGGKIYTANSEERYMKALSSKLFANALDTYSDNVLLRHEKTQVKSVTEIDYVILNAIYLDTFTAKDQLSDDKFDVEHIAPKEQMKTLMSLADSDGLPVSHIANLCYLPQEANRSKHEKNFYQDTKYLKTAGITLQEIEQKYSFTTKTDLDWMNDDYQFKPIELHSKYMLYLQTRYKEMKKRFLLSMGFDVEIEDNMPNIEYYGEIDNQFFVETKIGKLLYDSFSILSENMLLNDDDVLNLQNKEYSKEYFGCNYPVLIDNLSKAFSPSSSKNRYYTSRVFNFNGRDYYLTSEWYDESRELAVPWLKTKMIKK